MAKLFLDPLHPDDVASVIDFNAADEAIADRYRSLRSIQTAGVAALYNILCKRDYAYLADEVGMGKTFQALGLASIVWFLKPAARIVVVCPRKNLQTKWIRDMGNFVTNNYGKHWLEGDDIVKSSLFGSSVITPIHCENLWEFADSLFAPGRVLPVLRHTSFRRVAFLSKQRSVRDNWDRFYDRMMRSGLHSDDFSGRLPSEENAPIEFTERFGQSFNTALKTVWGDDKPIDLLIFDEAQYLRNPDNNSNTLFKSIFNNRVKKWLMLSATPLHSGVESIINQIDSYACANSPLFEEGDAENPLKLQSKLRQFLIRRPRMYVVSQSGQEMTKAMYRQHNAASDGIESSQVITSLSMALVQKELVKVLDGHNNRYKIGFLSSFESLQDSISKTSRARRRGRKMDFEQYDVAQDIELESSTDDDESLEGTEAPDERFVSVLSKDFESQFGRPLPHPKLEHVVDSLWYDAFVGNQKVLLFVRRISTVKELEELFERKFTALVEKRVRDVWKTEIEWTKPLEIDQGVKEENVEEEMSERNERALETESMSPFRRTMSEGGWLAKFRSLFYGQRKHALFFQENWFRHIAEPKGISLVELSNRIPEELWRESIKYARKYKKGILKTERQKYLLVHAFARHSDIFGLDRVETEFWREFFRQLYSDATQRVEPDRRSKEYRDADLVLYEGFWEEWKKRFSNGHDLQLPTANYSVAYKILFIRELTKNWIGQWIRLSDTIIDLFYAEKKGGMAQPFFDYLESNSSHAKTLREKLTGWIKFQSLIMLNAISPGNESLSSFAGKTVFPELNNQSPVIGMTGQNVSETAIKQFKMPGYPQIIVCTDVLKEGEDLHLFCDKVIHYGLAWTSGDMEQRVGRVDRYFSQIERRLNESPDKTVPKLMIHYPHIAASLEREQVYRVMRRQAFAESIMDNSLSYDSEDLKELSVGADPVLRDLQSKQQENGAGGSKELLFDPSRFFPAHRALVDKGIASARINQKYVKLSCELQKIALSSGFEITGNIGLFNQPIDFRLTRNDGVEESWRFRWQYIPQTECYALEGVAIASDTDLEKFPINYAYFQLNNSENPILHKRVRCHFPLAEDGKLPSSEPFHSLCDYLKHPRVTRETDEQILGKIKQIIGKMELSTKVRPHNSHGFRFKIDLGKRRQNVTVYVYNKMILVSSQIVDVNELSENQWKSFKSPQAWIWRMNEGLSFGELNLHDEYVCLAKRIFHTELSPAFLRFVVTEFARSADLFEQKFVGADIL